MRARIAVPETAVAWDPQYDSGRGVCMEKLGHNGNNINNSSRAGTECCTLLSSRRMGEVGGAPPTISTEIAVDAWGKASKLVLLLAADPLPCASGWLPHYKNETYSFDESLYEIAKLTQLSAKVF